MLSKKQMEHVEKRRKKMLDILAKGPCTLRCLHWMLKKKEPTLTLTTVRSMVVKTDGVFKEKIRDLARFGGRTKAQPIVVVSLLHAL